MLDEALRAEAPPDSVRVITMARYRVHEAAA